MNTTADKLNKLLTSKADIKNALIEKGLTVSDVFSTYADQIRNIGVVATDDGKGNVTITIGGATSAYANGNLTIE